MAESLLHKRTADFWTVIRCMRGSSKKRTGMVDGEVSDIDISELFALYIIMFHLHKWPCLIWLMTSKAITNGVKQGGVLSPILFGIYMDQLFDVLIIYKLGCHIGHVFMGAFGYADDLILIAPTKR